MAWAFPSPCLVALGAQHGNKVIEPPFNGTGLSVALPGPLYERRRARSAVVMRSVTGAGRRPGPQSDRAPLLSHHKGV